jgi:hypothetical protein
MIAFIRGACGAVSTTRMPSVLNTSSNNAVNLLSRSLIKNRKSPARSPGAVSLIGFGAGSGIEVATATVVLIRLFAEIKGGEPDEARERRALQFIAVTFFVLPRT